MKNTKWSSEAYEFWDHFDIDLYLRILIAKEYQDERERKNRVRDSKTKEDSNR
jgi:hypothetical protein